MDILLHRDRLKVSEEFIVPASKSISNRLLIIRALSREEFSIKNISDANDTVLLQKLLKEEDTMSVFDAEDAGTAFRFMTAYLSLSGKNVTLTGSARMKERPVGDLVEALKRLGAELSYIGKEGYPPLQIRPAKLKSDGPLVINAGISSQFISALLMIAPDVRGGITLQLENNIVSEPYITMTIALMQSYGISCERRENMIQVAEGRYIPHDHTVEADWSGASYAYAWSLLSGKTLRVPFLSEHSLQGDAVIATLMKEFFDVKTGYFSDHIIIDPSESKVRGQLDYDFTGCPDLAPTMICLCAALGMGASFKGVAHLALKESDRMEVLKQELSKAGVLLERMGETWHLHSHAEIPDANLIFDSHEDHRIAMALSFFAAKYPQVTIRGAECVRKSFPGYFDLLQ